MATQRQGVLHMSWFGISTQTGSPAIQRGGWLDALRFVVAFMIILHHFQGSAPVPLEQFHAVFERGGFLLTNFFLIDSGYVLARVYAERVTVGQMSHGDFVRKRFTRVIPAHLIMATGLAGLVLAAAAMEIAPSHPEWFDWSQFPAQLFLVQAFGVHGGLGWNAPTWSVSALLGCYVLFPLIARRLVNLGPWAAMGLVIGIYTAANLAAWAVLHSPVYQMPMQFGFVRALPLFVLGMGLAQFASKAFIPTKLATWTGLSAAVALVVVQYDDKHALISIALIGLIILSAGAIPVVRKSKLVETAALVSFSMFITNEVVRIAWFGAADLLTQRLGLGVAAQWGLWVGGVTAALAFAVVFHFAIDMPLQRVVQPWTKRLGNVLPTRRSPVAQSA
jgi:peptidoglycan/LPS O-acetylase OafA/YrhL